MGVFGKHGRLEIASTQTKPTCVGLKTLFFPQSAKADFACVDANYIRYWGKHLKAEAQRD